MNISYLLPVVASIFFLSSCQNSGSEVLGRGSFEAEEVTVSSELSGFLQTFSLEEGQYLEKGQCMGWLDTLPLYLRKQQLCASMHAAMSRRPDIKKQLAAIEEQLRSARVDQERIRQLVKAQAANQKQLDDINAQVSMLESQLEASQSTLQITAEGITYDAQAIDYQIRQLEDQLNKAYVRAPIAGVVLGKYVREGELVTPGKPLFKIADTRELLLRCYINAEQLSQCRVGEELEVKVDFGSEMKTYAGRIVWISDKAEFTPKGILTKNERDNLVYAVKVKVKNDGFLKIGMYGESLMPVKK